MAPELFTNSSAQGQRNSVAFHSGGGGGGGGGSGGNAAPDLKASDVYAFGMLLWAMYTRKTPYEDEIQDDIQAITANKRY